MSAAKWMGALAIAVGVVLSSVGLYWTHEALRIRRAAYVSAADIKEYSISPYVYRGMVFVGAGVALLLAGIIGVANSHRRASSGNSASEPA